jgi:hypothetical protein
MMDHVILYMIVNSHECTPWESLEECSVYCEEHYDRPVHFIKVVEDGVEAFFRLGEVGKDDWYVLRKGSM